MIYSFETFELDGGTRELRCEGVIRKIEPQVFTLLELLISNPDRMVSKDEIMEKVWDGRIVSEAAVNSRIRLARQALGDDGKQQRLIKTAHSQGFRFIGAPTITDTAMQNDGLAKKASMDEDPVPLRQSIAVLAFDNMSGDPDQEYFSDGISEDIITELSRFRELFVIARNSSFFYKGTATKVQEIGRDLRATYLVEGSVRKSGQRIRVTVQLIETASGNHIWAERYDRELEDLFAVQDEITQAIVTVLPVRLRSNLIENARKIPSDNLSAYDYFNRARWLYVQTSGKATGEVLELLAEAVKADPNYAQAYAFMAHVHGYSVFTFSPTCTDPIKEALENIDQALSTGEGDHYVHVQAAEVYTICGEHDLAQFHSDKAVTLNPNDISALVAQGSLMTYSGNPVEGVRLLTVALGHDPVTPDFYFEDLAEAYYMMRDYEKAIEIYQRWQNPPVHTLTHLAACYAQMDQMKAAKRLVETFKQSCPKGTDFSFAASAHARLCKQPKDAEHWLDGYRKAGLM